MNAINDYETRREKDNRRENLCMDFLENNLFNGNDTYTRNYDRNTQRLGIDFSYNGWKTDLKTASSFNYNGNLRTGCLECFARYPHEGQWKEYTGWFLNNRSLNDTLMYAWIDKIPDGKDDIYCVEDIKKIEVLLVKNSDMLDYLTGIGWPVDRIEEYIKNNIIGHEWDWGKTVEVDGLKFNSPRRFYYTERPINILVSRNVYKELSLENHTWGE